MINKSFFPIFILIGFVLTMNKPIPLASDFSKQSETQNDSTSFTNNDPFGASGLAPTPAATRSPRRTPTPTPSPTVSPPEEPQITDPRFLQSMVLFGVVSVLVILLGVFINRDRLNPR